MAAVPALDGHVQLVGEDGGVAAIGFFLVDLGHAGDFADFERHLRLREIFEGVWLGEGLQFFHKLRCEAHVVEVLREPLPQVEARGDGHAAVPHDDPLAHGDVASRRAIKAKSTCVPKRGLMGAKAAGSVLPM